MPVSIENKVVESLQPCLIPLVDSTCAQHHSYGGRSGFPRAGQPADLEDLSPPLPFVELPGDRCGPPRRMLERGPGRAFDIPNTGA